MFIYNYLFYRLHVPAITRSRIYAYVYRLHRVLSATSATGKTEGGFMRESAIEKRFKDEVKKRGGRSLKFVSPGMRGVPDQIVFLPGAKTILAELKAPGEDLKVLQAKRAREFIALGYRVFKIDSYEAIDRFVREVFGE